MNRLAVFLIVMALSLIGATAASATVPILTGAGASTEFGPSPGAKGFGQVKPKTIFLGGDPTGLVCRIHWLTWGGRVAVGLGVGWTLTSHESVAEGAPSLAVVVLSRLGTWHGRPAYTRWGWEFPEGRNGFHPPVCQLDGHAA